MELIVVTPPDYFSGEGALINEFFANGLQLLHLRKPVNNTVQFKKLLSEIDPLYYSKISIHQHHELATDFALGRLHFTEQQRKEISAGKRKEMVATGYLLSTSIHALDGLEELDDFEYVFYGPVFNSISKEGYHTTLKAGFVLPPHSLKIFAIGGVTTGRLEALKHMGFDGAAVLGTIWYQSVAPLITVINMIKSINVINNVHR